MEERLQKVLARAGVASRRHAEELIVQGRVTVNGRVVTVLGTRVDPANDRVEVDGERVRPVTRHTYVLLHKPKRMLTTTEDPRGRPTVMGLVQRVPARLVPVGRLDWDAEGVLLLTDDTGLAHELLHPSRHVAKTYLVKVRGIPRPEALEELARGVHIEGGRTAPAGVELVRTTENHAWLQMTLYEGRNQQVKRMCAVVGHPVLKLKRERFAGLRADDLAPGQWRYLTEEEVASLRRVAGEARPETRRPAAQPAPRRVAGGARPEPWRPAVQAAPRGRAGRWTRERRSPEPSPLERIPGRRRGPSAAGGTGERRPLAPRRAAEPREPRKRRDFSRPARRASLPQEGERQGGGPARAPRGGPSRGPRPPRRPARGRPPR